ncbi:MAG: PH domain-containing protein [Opitutus sp.]|nr:PH domain-containing protein [Opitutus sp.]
MKPPGDPAAILAIERPHPSLWTYYWLSLLIFPPLLPILILPMWFRYHTMRYKFTAEGISMSWGILFRRETIINYARIQDIHLRSNFVERWLGLAKVLVQTASGSSSAELTLEGLKEFEAVRDFLYSKMRGVKEHPHAPSASPAGAASPLSSATDAELAATLRAVADELRAIRLALPGARTDSANAKEADRV